MTTPNALSRRIKEHALAVGFDRVGIAPVRESDHGEFYRRWLVEGRHGEMRYLARPDAVARRLDPRSAWPRLRSAVVVAHNYYPDEEEGGGSGGSSGGSSDPAGADDEDSDGRSTRDARGAAPPVRRETPPPDAAPTATLGDPSRGVIARYARGRDYHRVIKKKLLRLLRFVEDELGRELPAARAYVDTGPVLERELARRAGIGWFGRNTMLIDPRRGSYFFLGTLLLEVDLECDEPFQDDRCGSCSACIDACPTGALLGRDGDGAPVIDATRCISYLTIEHRGPIPRGLRPLIGNRIFGCDICQEVCPWNGGKFVQITAERDYRPHWREADDRPSGGPPLLGAEAPPLMALMRMSREEWDVWTRGSAMRRAGYAGFRRNVAVALGNWASPRAVPALAEALRDPEALVRAHAAWALGRTRRPEARAALSSRLHSEPDRFVRQELEQALLFSATEPESEEM